MPARFGVTILGVLFSILAAGNGEEGINFAKAKAEAENVIDLVWQRYELGKEDIANQFFPSIMNLDANAWEILKMTFATKIATRNQKFVMVWGGSSVTAGKDSSRAQAFPAVFERRMAELFRLTGVSLETRNIAEGANDCQPYDMCYETFGGPDPDWVFWEQSFNCGRTPAYMEWVARYASFKSAIAFFSASGGLPVPCTEPASAHGDTVPYISERWRPVDANITTKYNVNSSVVSSYKSYSFLWNKGDKSGGKFWSPYNDRDQYNSIAPHGFNLWADNARCRKKSARCGFAMNVMGSCLGSKNGVERHWITKETTLFGHGGKGASHHPTVGFHLLRGEIIAYNYAYILLDAIYMIEADLAGQEKMSDLAVKYAAALKALKEKTVVPKRGKLDSGGWIDHLPDCYSDFSPHFNPERRLSNLYVGSTSGWRLKYSSTPSPSHEIRNVYEAQAPFQTVSFKVLVKNPLGVKINVCAFPVTHGLNTVTFGLDLNVAQWDTLSSTSNYMPTDKADFNTSARNSGSDCRMIGLVNHGGQVPAGKHVLHAKTTSRGTAAVSYVVVMNNNIN